MPKKTKFFKNKKVIIAGIVLVLIIGSYFIFGSGKDAARELVTVMRGDVVEEVSVTGKVVPAKSIDLAFEKNGRITRLPATVGKKVAQGETLAQLENGDLWAQITQAEATLKTQEVKLDELKRGSRPEEIAIKQTELKRAEQDLLNYYRSVRDVLNDAYAKADDAVRAKTDDIFSDDDTPNPKLAFTSSNTQGAIDVASMRYRAGTDLTAWRAELRAINDGSSEEEIMKAIRSGEQYLSFIRDFLARTLDVVDGATGVEATTVSTYKSSIYTGRTNVNTSYTSLSSQEQTIASQKITVERIKNELALTLAGASSEQIASQEAQVEQARGNLMYYRTQYEKTLLRAPFSGTITKVSAEVGDITSGTPVVSLIGSGNFEIEANIAESDIAKVKVGNTARVTLDAYGKGVLFEATIMQIDLSETVLEGVATYKTKFQFKDKDDRILPGLTADVDVMSGKKENVLFVPTRNIVIDGGKYFVMKIEGENTTKTEITTGLRGSDGRTEVLSGVNEGDSIGIE